MLSGLKKADFVMMTFLIWVDFMCPRLYTIVTRIKVIIIIIVWCQSDPFSFCQWKVLWEKMALKYHVSQIS